MGKFVDMKTHAEATRLDSLKWLLVCLLVAVGIGGNMYYADQYALFYRVLALLGLAVVAGFIALQTARGIAFWELAKASKLEIRKVVWPTRQEAMQTTLVVVGFVLLVALMLWGLDSLLSWLLALAIG